MGSRKGDAVDWAKYYPLNPTMDSGIASTASRAPPPLPNVILGLVPGIHTRRNGPAELYRQGPESMAPRTSPGVTVVCGRWDASSRPAGPDRTYPRSPVRWRPLTFFFASGGREVVRERR